MSNRKKSLRNLVSAAIGQLLAIIIGFMLPRLFITNYGSSVNGLISSVNQILMYLGLFEAGVGAVTLQALYGPVAKREWSIINGVLSATNAYYKKTSVLYLLALLTLSLSYPLLVNTEMAYGTVCLIIFFCGLPTFMSFLVQAKYILFLRAEGKNYIISNLATLITVLTGLSKVVLILLGFNVISVIVATSFIHLFQSIYIKKYVKKNYQSITVNAEPDYAAIKQKNYMLIHQISGMVFQNTDVLILSAVSGLKVVSVYSIYKLVMSQMSHLTYIVQSSFDFVLGQNYQTDKEKYLKRVDLFESYFSAFTFALYAVVYFILFSFVKLYTNGVEDIVYADRYLVLLFVVVELLTIARMPMLQTINFAGHFRETTSRSVVESLINLSVSLVGAAYLGIYGVLAGTIIALFYRTNDIIIYANKRLLKRSPLHTYMIHLINIAVFILVQMLFSFVFLPINDYMALIKTSLIASAIALPMFLFVQTVFWRNNRKTVLNLSKLFLDRLSKR